MLSRILSNQNIFHHYYKLVLEIEGEEVSPRPGQFYSIRCSETTGPLLRRPLSFHRLIRDKDPIQIEMLYRVIGKGTKWLSKRPKSTSLDLMGPFGNGFFIAGASAIQIGTFNFVNPKITLEVIKGIESYLTQNRIEKFVKL